MSAVSRHAEPALAQGGQWLTMRGCKSVLVIFHTVVYARRLREVFSLLAADFRVQVVFTVAPHPFGAGLSRYLRLLGIATIPWEQALQMRFDLALAAGSRGVEQVRAPVIRLSHGAGHNKPLREQEDPQGAATRTPGMLSRNHLVHEGRLVPAALGLSHERDLRDLALSCPEAVPVATVVGDPSHDRILASVPRRAEYRRALGVSADQKLLLITSTWGPSSAFGRIDALLPQLLSQLPDRRYLVAVLVHPNVWAGHGPWQVRGWMADCLQRGIVLVPPEEEWEGLLLAADEIIGDHGSVTAYGTLTGAPILLTHSPERTCTAGSPAALLAAVAPVLSPSRPLADQLRYAAEVYRADDYAQVRALLTSEPGRFHHRMRALMYRLLGLGEPAYAPVAPPVELPRPWDGWHGAGNGVAS